MGIIPLQYKAGDTAESLGLKGTEQFSVNLPEDLKPRQNVMVCIYLFIFYFVFNGTLHQNGFK